MEIDGLKALVTGAGGFIGSHLVERLIIENVKVKAFVRYTSRSTAGYLDELFPNNRRQVEIIWGDLRDADAVSKAVKGVDIVYHLGALIGIPYSYLHPRETIDTNVMGSLNVLTACLNHQIKRVVHTSSSEVYGTARYVPIDEEHPLQAQSPYAASKIGADKIAESFYNTYDLPVVILRPFNTYGPRQSARAVIPTIISQALEKQTVLLGNLTPRRDFTYVSDTVNGFILASQSNKAIGRTINLGTSNDISIGDLVDLISDILGKQIEVKQENLRSRPKGSEVERLLSDITLAKEKLNWYPQVSIKEGLTDTTKWISQNAHYFRTSKYQI